MAWRYGTHVSARQLPTAVQHHLRSSSPPQPLRSCARHATNLTTLSPFWIGRLEEQNAQSRTDLPPTKTHVGLEPSATEGASPSSAHRRSRIDCWFGARLAPAARL